MKNEVQDRAVNQRDEVQVHQIDTAKEIWEHRIRIFLVITIGPVYSLLLLTTLAMSIVTGNTAYLDSFKAVLTWMTPPVGSLYGYYFFARRRKR